MVGFGQTVCLPRVPRCGECRLAEEGVCPFAKKGLKAWREREAKKIKVKQEQTPQGVAIVKDEGKMHASPIKAVMSEISSLKVEKSPLKKVKEEVISGYHIEHFS
jgi:endonuclease-3